MTQRTVEPRTRVGVQTSRERRAGRTRTAEVSRSREGGASSAWTPQEGETTKPSGLSLWSPPSVLWNGGRLQSRPAYLGGVQVVPCTGVCAGVGAEAQLWGGGDLPEEQAPFPNHWVAWCELRCELGNRSIIRRGALNSGMVPASTSGLQVYPHITRRVSSCVHTILCQILVWAGEHTHSLVPRRKFAGS